MLLCHVSSLELIRHIVGNMIQNLVSYVVEKDSYAHTIEEGSMHM